MSCRLRTALIESLSAHPGLSKSRLERLSASPIGLIHGRTVNLAHIASHGHGPARRASKHRRLQPFFQSMRLDRELYGPKAAQNASGGRGSCPVILSCRARP